jgi:hypothetical protein
VELTLQPLEGAVLEATLRGQFPQADPSSVQAAISRSGGFLGQAQAMLAEGITEAPQTEAFVQALCAKDELLLTRTLVPLEKWKRDPLIELLQQWTALLEGALVIRSGGEALSPLSARLAAAKNGQQLLEAIVRLQKCIEYAQGNVSPAAICGYLQWTLR